MKIDYKPLLKTLIDRDLKLGDLKQSTATIAKIQKGEPMSLKTIIEICEFLDCEIHEVVRRSKNGK